MEIVYTNLCVGEERVHIELTAEDVAALEAVSASHTYRLRLLIEEANRRLNPTTDQAPGPLCRCGHTKDRHTPRPGDAWPGEECADCRDEERTWANPQHHRYTPAPQDGAR